MRRALGAAPHPALVDRRRHRHRAVVSAVEVVDKAAGVLPRDRGRRLPLLLLLLLLPLLLPRLLPRLLPLLLLPLLLLLLLPREGRRLLFVIVILLSQLLQLLLQFGGRRVVRTRRRRLDRPLQRGNLYTVLIVVRLIVVSIHPIIILPGRWLWWAGRWLRRLRWRRRWRWGRRMRG